MTDFIAQLEPGLLYPALFVGLVLVGGFVLLPAMYLTLVGSVNLMALFLVTVAAAILSDSIWYFIGLKAKKDRLYSWKFIRKRINEANHFSAFFSKHGVLLVFLTKFVYGTRIASHVLAGMHKIHFAKFTAAISAGTAIWFWIFFFLIKTLDMGIMSAKATALRIQILFPAMIAILLFVNWFTGKYVRRRFLASSPKEE